MQKITFITALIRPQNLGRLHASIVTGLQGRHAWNWIIIVDGKAVPSLRDIPPVPALVHYAQLPLKTYGFLEKNLALEMIQEDSWIYFLDDDTELHPNFLNLFERSLSERRDCRGMVFSQLLPDGSARITPPDLDNYVGKIDMCQFVVRRSAIAYHRFFGVFGADGEFFNRIYRDNAAYFVFRDEIGFHHNNLRAGEPWNPREGYGRAY